MNFLFAMWLMLIISVLECSGSGNQVYYISDSCPTQPCVTVSQFVANSSMYLHSNTTLIFLPGNHSLESELVVVNISNLSLVSMNLVFPLSTKIICKPAVRFEFHNVTNVLIRGLEFIGCGGNRVHSGRVVNIENSTFLGQENTTTALELVGTTASIVRSSFISNMVGSLRKTYYNGYRVHNYTAKAGGAIVLTQSNVIIIESKFNGNSAVVGGAIFCEQKSNITILRSAYINNGCVGSKHGTGGALHCETGCSITVHDSNFSNNTATLEGGAIYIIEKCRSGKRCYSNSAIINGSQFSNNKVSHGHGGAIGVWKGGTAIIRECTFDNNEATGDGGAVHSGYSTVSITGSQFIGNKASHSGGAFFTYHHSILAVNGSTFCINKASYDGGAVFAFFHVLVNITQSVFHGNNANSGGAFMAYEGSVANIARTEFSRNKAIDSGGAISWQSGNLNIRTSNFSSNNAFHGGAIIVNNGATVNDNRNMYYENRAETGMLFISNCNASFSDTTISNNVGSLFLLHSDVSLAAVNISNNTNLASSILSNKSARIQEGGGITALLSKIFILGEVRIDSNTAKEHGGGLYLYQSELTCTNDGALKLLCNHALLRGGGIYAVSSLITVSTSLHICQNNSSKGGGVYLEKNAKIFIATSHASYVLNFTANTAQQGGAMYVDDANCGGYATTDSVSSLCFIQQEFCGKYSLVFFKENNASFGHILYGGLLDRCTPHLKFMMTVQYNKFSICVPGMGMYGVNYFQKLGNIADLKKHISSDPVRVCFCRNNEIHCNDTGPVEKHVKKGESFPITLAAVDQVNNSVTATVHGFLSPNTGGLGEGQSSQRVNASCTALNFSITSPNEFEQLSLYADGPCKDARLSVLKVKVWFLPCTCPLGFEPDTAEKTKCRCKCDSKLYPYITKCDSLNHTVLRQGTFWITYINSTHRNFSDSYLIYPHCPLDYCHSPRDEVYINLNSENGFDAQCSFNRSGLLCGKCRSGFSLSLGSPHCIRCSANQTVIFTVILLTAFLAGLALVALILILNLTVAIGKLNGIIFYANIINANSSTFFSFSHPNFVTVLIAWLNFELGIDTCFFEGMDTFWKTLLQLAFPAYVLFLVVMVILLSECSTRFAQLIGRRNPVATLNTLIQLSYAKLLSVVIAAFSFASLEYPDGSHELVWFPDATIRYLQGKHIVLFLIALLILLVGVIYTALLFFWQWLLYHQNKTMFKWVRNQKLVHFLEPYHAPYNFKHRYWTGLLLLVRVILYIANAVNVSRDPAVDLLVIETVMICLTVLKWQLEVSYGLIYRKWQVDLLETICFLNLIFLSVANYYYLEADKDKDVVAYISGTITFTLLLFVIIHNVFTEVFMKLWTKLKKKSFTKTQINNPSVDSDQRDPLQPTVSWVEAVPSREQSMSRDDHDGAENDCSESDVYNHNEDRHTDIYSRSSSVDSTVPLLGGD